MKVKLNPDILNKPWKMIYHNLQQFGKLGYPKCFFYDTFMVENEFTDDYHGKMITVFNPLYLSTIVLIKSDCLFLE